MSELPFAPPAPPAGLQPLGDDAGAGMCVDGVCLVPDSGAPTGASGPAPDSPPRPTAEGTASTAHGTH